MTHLSRDVIEYSLFYFELVHKCSVQKRHFFSIQLNTFEIVTIAVMSEGMLNETLYLHFYNRDKI